MSLRLAPKGTSQVLQTRTLSHPGIDRGGHSVSFGDGTIGPTTMSYPCDGSYITAASDAYSTRMHWSPDAPRILEKENIGRARPAVSEYQVTRPASASTDVTVTTISKGKWLNSELFELLIGYDERVEVKRGRGGTHYVELRDVGIELLLIPGEENFFAAYSGPVIGEVVQILKGSVGVAYGFELGMRLYAVDGEPVNGGTERTQYNTLLQRIAHERPVTLQFTRTDWDKEALKDLQHNDPAMFVRVTSAIDVRGMRDYLVKKNEERKPRPDEFQSDFRLKHKAEPPTKITGGTLYYGLAKAYDTMGNPLPVDIPRPEGIPEDPVVDWPKHMCELVTGLGFTDAGKRRPFRGELIADPLMYGPNKVIRPLVGNAIVGEDSDDDTPTPFAGKKEYSGITDCPVHAVATEGMMIPLPSPSWAWSDRDFAPTPPLAGGGRHELPAVGDWDWNVREWDAKAKDAQAMYRINLFAAGRDRVLHGAAADRAEKYDPAPPPPPQRVVQQQVVSRVVRPKQEVRDEMEERLALSRREAVRALHNDRVTNKMDEAPSAGHKMIIGREEALRQLREKDNKDPGTSLAIAPPTSSLPPNYGQSMPAAAAPSTAYGQSMPVQPGQSRPVQSSPYGQSMALPSGQLNQSLPVRNATSTMVHSSQYGRSVPQGGVYGKSQPVLGNPLTATAVPPATYGASLPVQTASYVNRPGHSIPVPSGTGRAPAPVGQSFMVPPPVATAGTAPGSNWSVPAAAYPPSSAVGQSFAVAPPRGPPGARPGTTPSRSVSPAPAPTPPATAGALAPPRMATGPMYGQSMPVAAPGTAPRM